MLYSTSPTPFPLILGAAVAGNASRRLLPPPARGPPPCDGLLRHCRAPRGRLATLGAAPPSPAATLPRTAGTVPPPRAATSCRRRANAAAWLHPGPPPHAPLLGRERASPARDPAALPRWPAGPRPPRARLAHRRRAWPGQARQNRGEPPLSLHSNDGWGPLVRGFRGSFCFSFC